ncbi:hypothetical protein FQN57_003087 [Myotisia sp. PD_48]|nr:hypothetical protein FQN57_003087 [Myotisia sp. PD_48]
MVRRNNPQNTANQDAQLTGANTRSGQGWILQPGRRFLPGTWCHRRVTIKLQVTWKSPGEDPRIPSLGLAFMPKLARCCLTLAEHRWRAPIPHRNRFNHVLADNPFSDRQGPTVGRLQWMILDSVTLFTPNPSLTTVDSILSKLPRLNPNLNPSTHCPLILVTPAFASWLEEDHPFLPGLLQHTFRGTSSNQIQHISSVEAVVDRLPFLRLPGSKYDNPHYRNGMEGLALAMVDRGSIGGKLVPKRGIKTIRSDQLEPTLFISIEDQITTAALEIGMPTADTLFVSGRPYTMFVSRWESSRPADRDHDTNHNNNVHVPKLQERHDLRACKVNLQTKPNYIRPSVPLRPMTEPRQVVAGMGNILRTLSGPDNAPMPASTELEQLLPTYIKDNGLEAHRIAVWALITPQEVSVEPMDNVSDALSQRARLHRVMSGGGGWGQKRGLLSLDPDSRCDAQEPTLNMAGIHNLFDAEVIEDHSTDAVLLNATTNVPKFTEGGGIMLSPLREIAVPGDTVQFFMASLDDDLEDSLTAQQEPFAEADSQHEQQLQASPTRLAFRVIPAAVDASAASIPDGIDPDEVIVQPDQFGACSEKFMTYIWHKRPEAVMGQILDTADVPDVSGTKIDVPGSTVVVEMPAVEPFQ